jgi:catechol 2,3-dioxygenase-like lactoylglutathione lyase family enzyme
MEGIIAGLLKQFEEGQMTRRQLIQSLALAAAAAAPGGTAAAAQPAAQGKTAISQAFEPAPWKTVWLDHISYAVSDYRRSTAFYRDLMGWEIRNDNGNNQCTLKIGDVGGIIIRNRREPAGNGQGAGAPPAANAQTTASNRPPLTGVINHISWGVQPWETEKVKAELERRGLKPRPDMVGDTFKSFHVFDPDGWDLQISNRTKDSRD